MHGMATVEELLRHAEEELATAPFHPPRREARLLLSRVLGWNEARLLSRGETRIGRASATCFRQLLQRRLTGEPVAYLLGEKEFYGRRFDVDPRVLIPRPETEHLVEATLRIELPPSPRILDLGTGSGCLAVTLACEIPGALVTAVDRSIGATAVASKNIARHGVQDRVALLSGDLASAIDVRHFDLVVSNPPYVDPDETVSVEIADFEPAAAVFAPDDGLSIVRRLLTGLSPLAAGAPLCIEIGAGQAAAVERLLASSPFELLEILPDLAAIPRVVVARRR